MEHQHLKEFLLLLARLVVVMGNQKNVPFAYVISLLKRLGIPTLATTVFV